MLNKRIYSNIPKIKIPFQSNVYDNLKTVLKNENVALIPQIKNKLSCLIKRGKDKQ